jgi:hypothetical protein
MELVLNVTGQGKRTFYVSLHILVRLICVYLLVSNIHIVVNGHTMCKPRTKT